MCIRDSFGGDGAPDTLHIMGDAYVDGGVLKLTDAAVLKAGGKNGWLLFNLPPPRPALWQWRIEFDVYVGGGTGGEGFSVVYGPLPDLYALEFQGGISHMGPSTTHDFLGLSVMFQTVRSGKIWVKYDDVTLKYIEVGTVLRSAQWMHVEIEVVELVSKTKDPVYGVTIVHDGWSSWAEGKSTAEIVIPGWAPQAGWRFGMGASCSGKTDYHWIDNLKLESTWLASGALTYPLALTLNGQQFEPVGVNVSYAPQPLLSSVMPSIGPASGNTYVVAHGHNLGTGDNYKCRFGDARKGLSLIHI